MATLTIRKLDEKVKAGLRVRAAQHGRSMEEEARRIITDSVALPKIRTGKELLAAIRKIVEPVGGVDLPELPKQYLGKPRFPR